MAQHDIFYSTDTALTAATTSDATTCLDQCQANRDLQSFFSCQISSQSVLEQMPISWCSWADRVSNLPDSDVCTDDICGGVLSDDATTPNDLVDMCPSSCSHNYNVRFEIMDYH
jgi:hypothetical protein